MKKILIVDDEQELCDMMKACLEETGEYEVAFTVQPQEAITLCEQVVPDLLLLDIVMPELNGTELIKAVKENHALAHLKIVVTSGLGEMVYHQEKDKWTWEPNRKVVHERGDVVEEKSAHKAAQAYGVDDFLAKPFTRELLLTVVAEVMGRAAEQAGDGEED